MIPNQKQLGLSKPDAQVSRPPIAEAIYTTLIISTIVLGWIATLDGLSLGWDSMNHHFYLGWMAVEGDRLDIDAFAAGSMSCQFPYSYAPLYWLQNQDLSGTQAAMVLSIPAISSIPAVWLITWSLYPQINIQASIARIIFTGCAFMSPLWWSLLDSTSNDIIASLPTLWAFAIVIWRAACDFTKAESSQDGCYSGSTTWFVFCGVFVAISLMLKISQAFAACSILTIALASAGNKRTFLKRSLAMFIGALGVVLTIWGPWAFKILMYCGSPIYPMLTHFFR